ncbi:hypothetical protein KX928_06290 [Roseobacter sp. YSTF-M11]|uniref:Uncharacterized protein n=1 Tax=Roseobacter insulae TaxID=2859783 RepID=A0A9X1FTB1_9RHOB|nr:hypothetical protein [Roseobacter insulae]MBW4707390.1 hypothetical protein [Roseobacter insulae]
MAKQESFRFVQLVGPRPRQISPALDFRITPFGRRLLDARESGSGSAVLAVARDFIEETGVDEDRGDREFAALLTQFCDMLADQSPQTLSDYANLVSEVFGRGAQDLLEDRVFDAFRDRVFDRLVSLKLVTDTHFGRLNRYVKLQRAIAILERIAEGDAALNETTSRRLLRSTLELPAEIFPLPADQPDAVEPQPDESADEIAALSQELQDLEIATEEVLTLGAHDLEAFGPTPDLEPGRETATRPRIDDLAAPRELAALLPAPVQNFEPDSRVLLRASSLDALSAPTRRVLATVGITNEPVSLSGTLGQLEGRSTMVAARLARLTEQPDPPQFLRIGTSTIPTNVPAFPAGGSLANPEPPRVPTSVGMIRPTHIGILRKTQQHILRYEAEEIAHVENVVIGETKDRETRRLRRTEDTVTREEETIRDEERDLQTTERTLFQRDAQLTLKEDQKFKLGASVSASYGPVEVSVDTEFSTESSAEAINRTASTFARELLEKTALRISERVRREEIVRTIQEFEETNQHGFENETEEHIAAMFQWLVKVYSAQVYDYGARLFVNVPVPEPQFFLLNTLKKQKGPLADLVEPDPIDFSPSHLRSDNYMKYVRKYQVDGIEPPPPAKRILSKVFRYPESAAPQSEPAPEEMTNSLEMGIPNGYKAVEAYIISQRGRPKHGETTVPGGILSGVTVFIGESYTSFLWDQSGAIKGNYHKALDNETGSIMIGLHARNIQSYVIGIQITLLRTGHAMNEWKLKTYDAIVARYQAMMAEYRERKAELEAQEGIVISGRNPLENRLLERTELTRTALSMITGQNFEEFDAILGFMDGRIDAEEAVPEARYARFFMNCFEWENMTYQFLPYFWGRRSTWKEKLLLQDVDPLHSEFLKCGYADVNLPVRPGFEAALMHWLDTGLIWQGSEPPEITNPRYAPFLDDLRDRRETETEAEEVPVGDPWEIPVYTTLVRIRPGNSLPEWQRDEDTGEFIPVPESD